MNSSQVKLLAALVLTITLIGCGRYEGHNGYYFAWRDFKTHHIVEADYNRDGITTRVELDTFTSRWLQEHNWVKRDGYYQIYDKNKREIPALDFVSKYLEED